MTGDGPRQYPGDGRGSPEFETLLAEFIDQLNRSGFVDPEQVLARHPDLGPTLLEDLKTYAQLQQDERMAAPLGTLGEYTLRRQIGRGGMGVVYEAWENSLDRRVALKVLPPGVAADPRSSTRFLREAQIAAKLSHPQIVPVHATGIKDGTPWYAMEFVQGETLAQVLPKLKDAQPETGTPFGPKDQVDYFAKLARCFAEVANGLQHAHSKGIIHRDIKPSNLILDSDGRLRILDFGLARLEGQESLTISGDLVGTPLYMSPEQARRKKIPVDHRTDVYSLGATLYEMLTLQPPFRGKDHEDTLSQIIERDPLEPRKLNPRVPKDLETIALKCLRKEAADRFGTAEALEQDLRRFVRGDPIEARPEASLRRAVRWTRAHRFSLALTISLALVGVAGVSLALIRHRARREEIQERYDEAIVGIVGRLQLDRLTLEAEKGRETTFDPRGLVEFLELSQTIGGAGAASVRGILAELDELAELDPSRPDAYYHRASARLLLGDEAGARADLALALARRPDFTPAKVLRRELDGDLEPQTTSPWARARAATAAGDWEVAESAYGAVLEQVRAGTDIFVAAAVEARLGRAHARSRNGRLVGAVEDLGYAKEAWPKLVETYLLLAKVYLQLQEGESAERVLAEMVQRSEDSRAARLWSALFWISNRDHARALKDAEALDDKVLETWLLLQLGEATRGLEKSSEWVRESPYDPHAWFTQAIFDLELAELCGGTAEGEHRIEIARRSLEQAVSLGAVAPVIARSYLGRIALLRGCADEARRLFEEEVRSAPDSVATRNNIAFHYFCVGLYAQAAEHFKAASDIRPQTADSWGGVASSLERLGAVKEAVPYARRALDLERSADRLLQLGRLLRSAGDAECATVLAKALDAAPARAAVELIECWEGPGAANVDPEAEERLRSLEQEMPDGPPSLLFALGRWRVLSGAHGDLLRAAAHVERALAAEPENAGYILTLARIRFALGETSTAIAMLEDAQALPHAPEAIRETLLDYSRRAGRVRGGEARVPPPAGDLEWLAERLKAGEPLRIDSGTDAETAGCAGWERDRFFQGGWAAKPSFRPVEGVPCAELYRTWRCFPGGQLHQGYHLPVPRGRYRVILHFCEMESWEEGSRAFDVIVEDETLGEGFDPAMGGVSMVRTLTGEVMVEDEGLDISFRARKGIAFVSAIELERVM